ncbi:peptidylprolyl isomerase [Paenibacillus turpanensis]|uniref:peptidylprolyl isomerase n=1 Tax=Paenibacillus turpanensis TaxID=2689078 RepID=UPI0014092259|nr:peptidylprolyl isomerase [Paenibacillus turpanensis]
MTTNNENTRPEDEQVRDQNDQQREEVHQAVSEADVRNTQEQPAQARPPGSKWPWISLAVVAVCAAVVFVSFGKPGTSAAVATVNGENITQQQLYDAMVKQGGEQTLDALITEALVNQQVKKNNITVTDEEVNAEIEEIKKNFPTEEEFNMILEQNNLTMDSLKVEMKKQVSLNKLLEPQVTVTEEDMKIYYDSNKPLFVKPEQVRASHILLKTKEEAEVVLKQLQEGADFATVAKEKSQDPGSGARGGDLSYFGRGDMVEPFENAAFALNVGEMSGIVESQHGFHIIKLTDKKAAENPTFEEKKEEIKKQLMQQKTAELYPDWLQKLKTDSKIENFLNNKPDTAA